jgi:hypothetical protein
MSVNITIDQGDDIQPSDAMQQVFKMDLDVLSVKKAHRKKQTCVGLRFVHEFVGCVLVTADIVPTESNKLHPIQVYVLSSGATEHFWKRAL